MTIHLGIFLLILMLTAAVGSGAGWILAQTMADRKIEAARAQLERANSKTSALHDELIRAQALNARLEEENYGLIERTEADSRVLQALSPITKQLDLVNSHVQKLETHTAAQHAQVVTQLNRDTQVHAELSQTTAALNAALRSTTARGSWGEIQLRRVVEAAGMLEHVDFDVQIVSSTGSRPDMVIHLPSGGHIPLDAKVPMSAYLEAQAIPSDDLERAGERQRLLAKHSKAMRSHINALIKRNYPADFPESPQLTVLYLPAESLLAEAVDTDPTLLEHALSSGVALATPSSLLALLRSVAAVWSSASASEEARAIVELGKTLVERIGVVVNHLERLGKTLGNSVTHYNAAIASLESRLLVTARSFETLKDAAPSLEAPDFISGDSAQVRQVTAPEFNIKNDRATSEKPRDVQHADLDLNYENYGITKATPNSQSTDDDSSVSA